MRLWHEDLLPLLPRQQLLGQHRECCALRGNGWGKKHETVDYVFTYGPEYLMAYHHLVMDEMQRRGYQPAAEWRNPLYRGKVCPAYEELPELPHRRPIYKEHHHDYFEACVLNLRSKGIAI